ncbi:FAD-dependent oxidoreductase [Scenedesmus sp. NREL 46B-D3]|nr:FAD-dependent oxidoreductase [Scenedesmus sp. NREL 46B-D3]
MLLARSGFKPSSQHKCSLNNSRTRLYRRVSLQVYAMATDANEAASRRVVICGGGIMGAATAYYLSQLGVAATVVEREAVAAAASGKAGGFLALDWNDGSPVGPLAQHSYALHAQLAGTFGSEEIGYRQLDTLQVAGQAAPSRSQSRGGGSKSAQLPGWLDGGITACSRLGSKATTAQVHPAKLTHALVSAAEAAVGSKLLLATVTGVTTGSNGAVTSVRVQRQQAAAEEELPADAVVLAMGPWTDAARAWLPAAPVTTGQKYHSVVLRPKEPVSDTAIFTSFRTADGRSVEPELYPRPDGTVYACGEPQAVPVPGQGPAGVTVDASRCDVIKGVAGSLASCLADAAVEAEQACYLPLSSDGLPVIGRLPGVQGVYVATGHSCWGILNGPATGQAVAELIVHGSTRSLDISAFDPVRVCGVPR